MEIIKYGEFYNDSNIDEVNFDEIEEIGESAFANSSISRAMGIIRNVGNFGFSVCEKLQGAIKVAGMKVGRAAFERCPLIEEVVLGDDVRQIDGWAFDECEKLRKITLPNSLKSIGEEAFHKISITELNIGSIDEIKSCAFSECSQLQTVNIGNIKKSIKSNAFSKCPNLKNIECNGMVLMSLSENQQFKGIDCTEEDKFIIKYDEIITDKDGKTRKVPYEIPIPEEIQSYIEYGHEELKQQPISVSGSIKSNAKKVKDGVCRECKTITEVILDSVERIGNNAFDKCSNLRSVSLPASLTEIGRCAFQDSGIEEIDLSDTRC